MSNIRIQWVLVGSFPSPLAPCPVQIPVMSVPPMRGSTRVVREVLWLPKVLRNSWWQMIIFIRSAGETSGCSVGEASSSSEAMLDAGLAKNPSNLVRNLCADGVSGSGDGAGLLDASDVGVGIWVIHWETQVTAAFDRSRALCVVALDRSSAFLVAVDGSTAASVVAKRSAASVDTVVGGATSAIDASSKAVPICELNLEQSMVFSQKLMLRGPKVMFRNLVRPGNQPVGV